MTSQTKCPVRSSIGGHCTRTPGHGGNHSHASRPYPSR